MKKGIKHLARVMSVLSLLFGFLGTGRLVHAADLKIGTVNFQAALNDVDQGKKAKASLKADFDAKQKKLQIQSDELKKMQEDLEKNKGTLSQDAMASKQKVMSDKYMEIQKSMAGYREELVSKEGKMTSQILVNLKSVVAEIGKSEGFTLVVESSQDAVLYVQSKEDLTSRVVALYNKKFTGPLSMK